MLNPNNDRLDYGQMLSAPDGYQLDFAVGTTYSLDLDALVGACIALGLSEETDSDLMKNPICLLEALRATGDKVALFCEGGQIHLPGKVSSLYILLESMVFQVNAVKRRETKGFPSFHPKFWLLRYVGSESDPVYRVVVLSRNLTFDRSWDVSFYMDGKRTKVSSDKNNPVSDFLQFLTGFLSSDTNGKGKQKKIRSMMKELPYIKFETGSKEFEDFDFLPTGIRSSAGGYHSILDCPLFSSFNDPAWAGGLNELLIMSPFISKDIIRYFNDRSRHMKENDQVLITRAASLGRIKEADCDQFRIYTMKDAVLEGESAISDGSGGDIASKQDIHAKVYLTRKYSDTSLYLGSLNASHNAVFGNVEFMLCLHSKNRYLNLEKLTASLWCGDEGGADNPFQRVSLEDIGDEKEDEAGGLLDGIIKKINRGNPVARITENNGLYDATVHFASLPDECNEFDISVSPLLANKAAKLDFEVVFTSLALTDLSLFYTISVNDGKQTVSRIIKVPTEGMPENREQAVISDIVHDKACFYRYVAFLLGDSYILSVMESDAEDKDGTRFSRSQSHQIPALYEKMLHTAWTAPERFKEIDFLLHSLSKDGVVPEYFEEVYQAFRKAVKI